MVNIIENWTEVTGEISDIVVEQTLKNFHTVILRIMEMKDVEHFPNLIRPDAQNEIPVRLPSDVIQTLNLKKGDKINALIRTAGLNLYFFRQDSIKVVNNHG